MKVEKGKEDKTEEPRKEGNDGQQLSQTSINLKFPIPTLIQLRKRLRKPVELPLQHLPQLVVGHLLARVRVCLLLVPVDEDGVPAAEATRCNYPVCWVPCHVRADSLHSVHIVRREGSVLLSCINIPHHDLTIFRPGHEVFAVGAQVKLDRLGGAGDPRKPLGDSPPVRIDKAQGVVTSKHEYFLSCAVHPDAVDSRRHLWLRDVSYHVEGVVHQRPDDQPPRRVPTHHLRLDRMHVQGVHVGGVAGDDLQNLS
mmetsp:Transcript_10278/g.34263  ORF Transcript_10278/g.34263 Transcript_10278/m.34263 type:complete len:254 (+) Transcript_10278:453-1214(+)